MSDLSDRLSPYKMRAQRHKRAAVQARQAGDLAKASDEFDEARYAIDEAFEEISSRGTFSPIAERQIQQAAADADKPVDQATKDVASELADCWGILGGIYRAAGEMDEAIKVYDNGYDFEKETKYAISPPTTPSTASCSVF